MQIRFFILIFLLSASVAFAQTSKTDTVQRGYYIPFGPNYMSCKVEITPLGKKAFFANTTGNKLPDSLMNIISYLEPGSVVAYTEVTVMSKGMLEKVSGRRYVVGTTNTSFVKRDPFYPDTLTAKEIAAIELDPHVYQFSVSWFAGGSMSNYELTGNGVFGSARTAIEALPSGTKVYFENIRRKEDDGSKRVMPAEIHVVR